MKDASDSFDKIALINPVYNIKLATFTSMFLQPQSESRPVTLILEYFCTYLQ